MKRFLAYAMLLAGGLLCACRGGQGDVSADREELAPGVVKLSVGKIDPFTPYAVLGGQPRTEAMERLPEAALPFDLSDILIEVNARGCRVTVPLADDEQLYGFGMQYATFGHRGSRKRPIVNDNPLNDLGYSHAPQPC